MQLVVRPITQAMLAFLLLAGFARAAAPGYTFTILAQTGDSIDGKTLTLVGYPVINNAGTVVFPSLFQGGSGIFTTSGLLVQAGDTISGETLTNIVDQSGRAQLAINNAGTVAFVGDFAGGTGIFTPSTVLVKTGDVIDGKTLLSIGYFENGIGINDTGTVVFSATFTPFEYLYANQGEGIFTNSTLVEADVLRQLYNPQINNAGTIVFAGVNAASEGFIATQSGDVGGCGDHADYPAINNAGTIAYSCGFESQTTFYSAICTTTSDCWGTGTIISGKKLWGVTGFARPALNDAGTLVFNAVIAGSPAGTQAGNGIFTPSELLISTDDAIAEKSVTAFGTPALNNSGVIVFAVSFADGSSGIVMATPISTGVAGDANNDGVVDCADLAFMTNILGKTYGQAGFDPRADMNGDGVIDIRDLAFVAQHLPDGTSCQ